MAVPLEVTGLVAHGQHGATLQDQVVAADPLPLMTIELGAMLQGSPGLTIEKQHLASPVVAGAPVGQQELFV